MLRIMIDLASRASGGGCGSVRCSRDGLFQSHIQYVEYAIRGHPAGRLERPRTLQYDLAQVSLTGDREANQDRVTTLVLNDAALAVVVDGMGGHAEGERAAEVAIETLLTRFREFSEQPAMEAPVFLRRALSDAHTAVVQLGTALPLHLKPRATCALCIVRNGQVCWAHVGDSRVYFLRAGKVLMRTRDHSHVELLRREGLISEKDLSRHPMRNYVELCLGGEPEDPSASVSPSRPLEAGDTMLVCSDGFWSGLTDEAIAQLAKPEDETLEAALLRLATSAVKTCSPHSDNTSVAAVRWHDA
jgi:PPM family protein phosphatase